MIVNELFNGNDQVEEIDVATAKDEFNLWDADAAYLLPIKGDEYVFYLEDGKDGRYNFGYGKAIPTPKGGKAINHRLTGGNEPFSILPAVMQALGMMLAKYQPVTISFSGYQPRQQAFYAKLLPFLKRKLPKPYVAAKETGTGKFIITRDVENPNFVFEDAPADIQAITSSEEIATKFMRWLATNNEETPIEDLLTRRRIGPGIAYFANGEKFGCDYNLNIGFIYEEGRKAMLASMFQGRDERRPVYFVLISLPHDPAKDVDLVYRLPYETTLSNLVHELTHYQDRERQKTPTRGAFNQKVVAVKADVNRTGYFNSPLEFNAYFQQGAHAIYSLVNNERRFDPQSLSSFEVFKQTYLREFHGDFMQVLTPENKRRFNNRLYKLYTFLVEKFTQKQAA